MAIPRSPDLQNRRLIFWCSLVSHPGQLPFLKGVLLLCREYSQYILSPIDKAYCLWVFKPAVTSSFNKVTENLLNSPGVYSYSGWDYFNPSSDLQFSSHFSRFFSIVSRAQHMSSSYLHVHNFFSFMVKSSYHHHPHHHYHFLLLSLLLLLLLESFSHQH